jgi:hypothetical protein
MTYDPNDPRRPVPPTYDPNDPRRPVVQSDGMSTGAMAGIAFALLLFLGVMFWAFTGTDRQTATTGAPPATTGQRAPAPAPAPVPERAPAPAPAPKAQ